MVTGLVVCDDTCCYLQFVVVCCCCCFFFFFKQKTAYEMRISDWSSDVCSSDLPAGFLHLQLVTDYFSGKMNCHISDIAVASQWDGRGQIGRASCRERVCQYV